ncbi:type III-B CRISPR-associated protein Cas10/Cmr2 [Vallitalea sediminicola]
MSYLLGITMGPVQPYIVESRKLIDLFNSSSIISDIMKEIHKKIESKFSQEDEIIYPNHEDEKDIDYSNYMIYKVHQIFDLQNIEIEIFDKYESDFKNTVGNNIKYSYQKLNLKEYFNVYWVFEEIKNGNYYDAYDSLTWKIESLKNTHEFEQIEQRSMKKCHVCGNRNIVTHSLTEKYRRDCKLNKDEELCNMCLFKRIYSKDKNNKKLNSVYKIAIKNWKRNNKKEISKVPELLEEIFIESDKYYNPDEISYVINLAELKLNGFDISKDKKYVNKKIEQIEYELRKGLILTEQIKKLTKIKNEMKDIYKEIKKPIYEYAFIQFDIDNLGKWISGYYLEDRTNLRKYQKEFSKVIIEFGCKLRKKLSKNNCEVIYSGGDDFLGVLPIEDIIHVMNVIDVLFKEDVEEKLSQYTTYKDKITYSSSITIAQCKDPMSYALDKTRKELENIKKMYEEQEHKKNGVAITYIVNNSKEITGYLKKSDFKVLCQLAEAYSSIKYNLTFSYIYNYEKEISRFNIKDVSYNELQYFNEIAVYELTRLMKRSQLNNENLGKEVDEYIEKMSNFIRDIICKNYSEIKSNHCYIDYKNIINILKLSKKMSVIDWDLSN